MNDTEGLQVGRSVDVSLRDRIAAVIIEAIPDNGTTTFLAVADAVIKELDLGIPCAANGCRMRQITRKAAEKSQITEEFK